MTTIPPTEGRLEDVLSHITSHSPQGENQRMRYIQIKGLERTFTIRGYLEHIKHYAHMAQAFLDHPVRFEEGTLTSLRTGEVAFVLLDEEEAQ